MSEYVRFVSYVYAYHEDVRGVNVGYVKFESRSGVKRFYMQLSGIRNRERLGVYLFIGTTTPTSVFPSAPCM